ncbi:MAG: hypothetical protein ACXVUL_11450 [Solirubrobacteraceae bacterium]
MAKEKAHTDKRGWFAHWRERRTRSKLRANEITRRLYDERSSDAEREARTRGYCGGGG